MRNYELLVSDLKRARNVLYMKSSGFYALTFRFNTDLYFMITL